MAGEGGEDEMSGGKIALNEAGESLGIEGRRPSVEVVYRIALAAARAAFAATVTELEREFGISISAAALAEEIPPEELMPDPESIVPVGLIEKRSFLVAVENRDIGTIFLMLQRLGITQRRIADVTGQKQSEIHEILNGRNVQSHDVLVRIFRGLGIPLWWGGLGYIASPGLQRPRQPSST